MSKKSGKVSAGKVILGVATCGVSLLFTGVTKKERPTNEAFVLSPDAFLWNEMLQDKTFNSLQNELYNLSVEVEADYAVICKLDIKNDRQLDAFEAKCVRAMSTVELLIPLWNKYHQTPPQSCEPLKRLAMVRERRGKYEAAAFVCVKAIRLGMSGDGTNCGMRGRLARIVSSGNVRINKEIANILEVK